MTELDIWRTGTHFDCWHTF